MKHIAVFASGNGSNAENLIRYFNEHPSSGKVALIVCNKENAGVVNRAKRLGVPIEIINKELLGNSDEMLELLNQFSIDLIVLAGFLMMIPSYLTCKYENRILNIHPSLLPAYGGKGMYGHKVHEAVVEAGEKESGITVHLVTDECDKGKIIAQVRTDVLTDDTPQTLESKIHDIERIHFPSIVEQYIKSL